MFAVLWTGLGHPQGWKDLAQKQQNSLPRETLKGMRQAVSRNRFDGGAPDKH